MTTYLDAILAAHRALAADDDRDVEWLIDQAGTAPPTRGFRRAIAESEGLAVIAEVKRRSPSKGDLFADLDPAVLAAAYEGGGATCLSVLTDVGHFGGSPADLATARAAVGVPVLRKDFTVSPLDVCDARLMGADAVLLIAAALDDGEMRHFAELARALTLDVLVEVHDEAELERALAIDADMVGVNQRDLVTFEVDTARAERVAPLIPPSVVRVAESGVRGPDDARRLADAGYDAVLVGESLVTAGDPGAAVEALRAVPARQVEG
ncbi:indole-3-glycerol phosphate synthase TrpC [Actinomarinicola tropica]|uniref:Indole-3-glycerol phosphate synthase n=1 Tax=Actinomarinicola tropica TaxID=2789776 RepID=A0A5Q2RLP2_9ACTN|nr:indole-3-glycerol phosphate synthase TrpC [Actinomarinicola tropica]QGG95501.1 indole-3-glycerol phosphate synthase TrpC [Actinomarinicola tropica]